MRFGILGPLEVEVDGRPAAIAGRRQRSVLAVLLVADERSVTADQLIEQVWGRDLPANPANTLQHTVAQLRKVLEPGRPRNQPPQVLVSTDDGYRIDLTGHELDAREFEAHLAAASAAMTDGRAATAVATTEAALALWRGPALTEFDGVEAAEAEATRLAERLVDARQLAIDARSAVDGPAAVVAELESLVKEHPHREGLWARLMTALYQSQRQADALRTYQRAAATLADELGLVPSNELRQLEQRILQHDPGLAPKRAVPGNLPTPTNPLIGRQELTAVIAGALSRHRLVTLLGPGGAGKTRLAVEVGGAIVDHGGAHPDAGATGADGVWLARLDNLWDPSLLALSIGTTLGLAESPEGDVITNLAGHIGRRRLLLVLDNCEHLTEAVGALVARLLADCPHLVVLATSQAPLSVTGEHRVPVPPLGLPADGDSPFARLDAAPAIELFLARAAAVDLTRRLDDEELSAVANIVRALDGNPLAIELAAARTDVYTPTEIARLMADRFEVLAGGPRDVPERQRTLRSALAWSVGLLSDEERWFFARVSVFAGGFDTEAAATLTDTDEPAVRRLVAGLLARSVLGRDEAEGPDPRFRLLETVRLYGRSLLDDDELAAVRARHAEVFADRVARLEPQLGGPDQADAFRRYVLDGDNLRAAMAWSLDHPEGTAEPRRAPAAVDRLRPGVRIAARTGRFWDWRGSLAEADMWLTRFATAAPTDRGITDLGLLLSWHGFFTAELGDAARAAELSAAAIAVAEADADHYGLAVSLSGPAFLDRLDGRAEDSLARTAEMRALARRIDEPWMEAWTDNHDALSLLDLGRAAEAADAAQRSYDGFATAGDRRALGWALTALAQVALDAGDGTSARVRAEEAMALSVEFGDGRNAAWAAELAAAAHRLADDPTAADALEQQAAELLSARGMPLSPWHQPGR